MYILSPSTQSAMVRTDCPDIHVHMECPWTYYSTVCIAINQRYEYILYLFTGTIEVNINLIICLPQKYAIRMIVTDVFDVIKR